MISFWIRQRTIAVFMPLPLDGQMTRPWLVVGSSMTMLASSIVNSGLNVVTLPLYKKSIAWFTYSHITDKNAGQHLLFLFLFSFLAQIMPATIATWGNLLLFQVLVQWEPAWLKLALQRWLPPQLPNLNKEVRIIIAHGPLIESLPYI